jgi:hypothetical protein
MLRVCSGLRESVSPLMMLAAAGRLTAHTKCRNGVKDLERSVKLCGRAVADNMNEGETDIYECPYLFFAGIFAGNASRSSASTSKQTFATSAYFKRIGNGGSFSPRS